MQPKYSDQIVEDATKRVPFHTLYLSHFEDFENIEKKSLLEFPNGNFDSPNFFEEQKQINENKKKIFNSGNMFLNFCNSDLKYIDSSSINNEVEKGSIKKIEEIKTNINKKIEIFDYEKILNFQKNVKYIKSETISDIILKVSKWLEMSKKFQKLDKEIISISKEKSKAAKEVHEKKKTLDDFLTKIRKGIALNYDFAKNCKKKFIHLRNYIKNYKDNLNIKWKENVHPDVDFLLNLINTLS